MLYFQSLDFGMLGKCIQRYIIGYVFRSTLANAFLFLPRSFKHFLMFSKTFLNVVIIQYNTIRG